MANKKKSERLFNNRARKLFRKHIPTAESAVGGFIIALLIVGTWWFFAQKENYDPGERDISMEVLLASSVDDTLYRTPLQRWVDPSQVHAYAGGAPLMDTGFFPGEILSGGWDIASRYEFFESDRMWVKINGADEQYLQYGCEGLHFISMGHPAEEIELYIEMYDMGALENALGILGAQRNENAEMVYDGPVQYYATAVGAIGIAGPFYVKISSGQPDPRLTEKAVEIIRRVADMEEAKAGLPRALRIFADVLDIPFERVAFEKSDVFQYQFASDFWFAQPDPASELRYFVHEGGSAEETGELYDLLLTNLLFDYEEVGRSETEATLKHPFLEEYLVIALDGATLYGVEGVESLEAAGPMMAGLKGAFSDEEG